jgi:hypothetical protein
MSEQKQQDAWSAHAIARLKRNLDDTSYNEGSEALACRLFDCQTYIEQLENAAAKQAEREKEIAAVFADYDEGIMRLVALKMAYCGSNQIALKEIGFNQLRKILESKP